MSNAGLEVFDASLQKTEVWVNDVMSELGWEEKPQKASLALRTALHALRDRLTVEEAVHWEHNCRSSYGVFTTRDESSRASR